MRIFGSTAMGLAWAVAAAVGASRAEAQQAMLEVGDRAPIFEGRTDEGETWRSREHVGRSILVVYFFPAAMTSGCTTQACMFRDNRTVLHDLGAEVIGVSGDRVEALKTFRGVNRLNFPLVSDTAGVIARAFGVPTREGGTITRDVEGEEVTLTRDVTMARWTYIIGLDGRIAFKETEVDPEGDSARVIAHIRRMVAAR
jgi:thioredoxin-dependent peroxiredoxin